MSIDTIQHVSPAEVDEIVNGPSSPETVVLVGAQAVAETFHNSTLNVIVPRGDSIGTTSTDPQRFLGRTGAAAYDRALRR